MTQEEVESISLEHFEEIDKIFAEIDEMRKYYNEHYAIK